MQIYDLRFTNEDLQFMLYEFLIDSEIKNYKLRFHDFK